MPSKFNDVLGEVLGVLTFITVVVLFIVNLQNWVSDTIDLKKMIWNKLYELRSSELLGVETHEPQDFIRLRSQSRHGFFNRLDQLDELSEVTIMSSFCFDLLPQIFNRIVVW